MEVDSRYLHVPGCGGDTRNSVFRFNLLFIDDQPTEFSGILVPLQRVSGDGGDIHLSSKIPGKIAEVSTLFDNRTGAARSVLVVRNAQTGRSRFELPLGLVPPVWLGDGLVRTGVTSDGGHDREFIYFDCLLHHLYGLEVSKHISESPLAGGTLLDSAGGTHPTEQMLPLSSIILATSKASLSSSNGPVATGFSTNKAMPGNFFKIWISISLP